MKGQYSQRMHEFLGDWRPRPWTYNQRLAADLPLESVLRAGDLLQDAVISAGSGDAAYEVQSLLEATSLVGEVRGVGETVIRAAGRLQRQGHTDACEALLEGVLKQGSYMQMASMALAQVRHAAGRTDEAIAVLEQVLDKAPRAVPIRRTLANMLRNAQRYAQAEAHLRQLLAARPRDPMLHLDLADVLARQGKLTQVQAELDKAEQCTNEENRPAVEAHKQRLGLNAPADQ
jgi:tetratricopeptide (TPR) repeat protein